MKNIPISSRTIDTNFLDCVADRSGVLRYNSDRKIVEYCDGDQWRLVSALASAPADPAPDAISFTDVVNQDLLTLVYSNELTVSGFDGSLSAMLSGEPTAEISVNNGGWVRSAAVTSGDKVRLRMNTAPTAATLKSATLTIGSTSDTWSATTRAAGTRIFVTATTYDGSQVEGLSGANTLCQSLADAQSYGGTWQALLSDAHQPALERIQFEYPVVNACDGSVVENTDMWGSSHEGAIRSNGGCSTGTTASWYVWTGTYASGTQEESNTCNSWFTTVGNGRIGVAGNSSSLWVSYTTAACSTAYRLYCVSQTAVAAEATSDPFSFTNLTAQNLLSQVVSDSVTVTGFAGTLTVTASGKGYPELSVNGGSFSAGAQSVQAGDTIRVRIFTVQKVNELHEVTVKVGSTTTTWQVTTKGPGTKIFVTNSTYAIGSIGSLAGADTLCQSEATAQGYAGTWIALLSDQATDAKDRINITYPVVNQCNNEVVEVSNMFATSHEAPIRNSACSTGTTASWYTWTGSFSDGTKSEAFTCTNWSSTAGSGRIGVAGSTTSIWMNYTTVVCTSSYRVFCVSN